MARKYEQTARADGANRTRARIVDAARALLVDAPSETLTVERIAERADVSRPTIYNTFGSKDGVFGAVAMDALDRAGFEHVLRAVDHEDPAHGMRDGIRAIVQVYANDYLVLRALFSFNSSGSDALAGAMQSLELERADCMEELAQRLDDSRLLRTDWNRARASDLFWTLTAFSTFELLSARGLTQAEAADFLISTAHVALSAVRD